MYSFKLIFVRHGQDEDNLIGIINGRRDTSLTEFGRENAKNAAEKLKNSKIDIILVSPLKRARQTAEIINHQVGSTVVIYPDLIERDFGNLTGKNISEVPAEDKNYPKQGGISISNVGKGEDYPSLYKRAKKVLDDWEIKYRNKNILAVAHGEIGRMIRAVYLGWSWEKGLEGPDIKNGEIIELEN